MTEYGLSLFLSVVATVVAVLAFARTFSRELPTVEFLVERDASERSLHRLTVPARRRAALGPGRRYAGPAPSRAGTMRSRRQRRSARHDESGWCRTYLDEAGPSPEPGSRLASGG